MPRTARSAVGGVVYHVLNRGNGRLQIFRKPGDYQAFLDLLILGKERAQVEIFGFCLRTRKGDKYIYFRSSFLGLPRWRKVDCRFICLAAAVCQG